MLGTIISAGVIAGILIAARSAFDFELSVVEALLFGSLISATDPVAVLSIFGKFPGIDENLYSVLLGESVLNDAVAIVLFETIVRFLGSSDVVTGNDVGVAIGRFIGSLLGSAVIGVLWGILTSMSFRVTDMHEHVILEAAVFLLASFVPFMLATMA